MVANYLGLYCNTYCCHLHRDKVEEEQIASPLYSSHKLLGQNLTSSEYNVGHSARSWLYRKLRLYKFRQPDRKSYKIAGMQHTPYIGRKSLVNMTSNGTQWRFRLYTLKPGSLLSPFDIPFKIIRWGGICVSRLMAEGVAI